MNEVKIFEKYNKLNKIGEGAFSIVYKAENIITKELVAIKEIPKKMNDKDIKKDIEKEIKFMEIFSIYPNSVRLIDKFEENDKLFIVTELCDGDLAKYLKKSKNGFSIQEIKIIMNQYNKILYEIRKKDMVHNDVKLENVLVKFKGNLKEFIIKLMDYGQMKLLSSIKDLSNNVFGIEPYIEGGKKILYLLEKIDLLNLGINIYRMIFKEPPKTFEELNENIDKFVEDKELLDLLKKLCVEDAKKRIDWEEYFNHKFFNIEKEEFEKVENIVKEINVNENKLK